MLIRNLLNNNDVVAKLYFLKQTLRLQKSMLKLVGKFSGVTFSNYVDVMDIVLYDDKEK